MIDKNPCNKKFRHSPSFRQKHISTIGSAIFIVSVLLTTNATGNGVGFHDIASDPSSGLNYAREPSPELVEILEAFNAQGKLSLANDPSLSSLSRSANRSEGSPGIAILDFDGDGDQDIYVTNGPGKPNSLFKNQFKETGQLTFVDVALNAGVDASDQDSNGVCYGDIDNDGDQDLYVLGRGEPNRLFENLGDGTFIDITETAGIGAGNFNAQVCAMGDINNDGLLDIVVGNSYDFRSNQAMFIEPYELNEPDQLFLNQGTNVFLDISETSGLRNLDFPDSSFAPPNAAGITWSLSMVDYDQDGDVDIIVAQDQGAFPHALLGGLDRGFIHILENDGNGNFSDVTRQKQMFRFGAWMGLDFGDLNCDGLIDMFATNQGDYFVPFTGTPYSIGEQSSRWLMGSPDGTFLDDGVGDLIATPFGWGAAIFDYDNDGDQDIVFHGGLNMFIALEASNPGVILNNQSCSGKFEYDFEAKSKTNHSRRSVLGVAIADLNRDGFNDIVSVSNFDTPEPNPLILAPPAGSSEFDSTAYIVPTWIPGNQTGELLFNPEIVKTKGSLSVEINSGDNGNGWVSIQLLGTAGLTSNGRVNRNGIGAVVSFKPENGHEVIKPLLAGSSHASQNSLELLFGMSDAEKGTIEVIWPGGVRNRLYNVRRGNRILLPEIPCSYDSEWKSKREFKKCVKNHLRELKSNHQITFEEMMQLKHSALKAYRESHKHRKTKRYNPFEQFHDNYFFKFLYMNYL